MSISKKVILILLNIIFLTVFIFVLYANETSFGFNWRLKQMNNSKWMSSFISQYFFVASTLLAIITILAILVVIFYPRTYTAILLKDDKGRLNINQSSIEGFVKEIILNDGYMKNPKIFVKVYKNKIRIQVKGEIIPRVQVVEKTEVLNQEVKDGLREFFGLNHKVNLQVDVTALSERDRQKSLRVI